jgi:hypothetical protein
MISQPQVINSSPDQLSLPAPQAIDHLDAVPEEEHTIYEVYNPRPSRRRRREINNNDHAEQDMHSLGQDGAGDAALVVVEKEPEKFADREYGETTAPKKRGRKRKAENPPEVVVQQEPAEAAPPAKRGRGRPRKSDQAAGAVVQADDAKEAQQREEPAGKQHGKPPTELKDGEGVDGGSGVLSEKDPNAQSQQKTDSGESSGGLGALMKSEDKVVEKAKGEAALKRSTSAPQFRVGLSKRSRIAPLLKIVRK